MSFGILACKYPEFRSWLVRLNKDTKRFRVSLEIGYTLRLIEEVRLLFLYEEVSHQNLRFKFWVDVKVPNETPPGRFYSLKILESQVVVFSLFECFLFNVTDSAAKGVRLHRG